jgi:hypothetical protein
MVHFVLPRTQYMKSAVGINVLTQKVIGCAIAVHRALGPGLLESVYRECMVIELRAQNLRVDCERSVGTSIAVSALAARSRLTSSSKAASSSN